jgi:hypothetical protein
MNDEPKTWLCPACGKRVNDYRAYVAAIEGEDGADFGFDGDPLWLRRVRFHEDHFQERIRGKVYMVVDRVSRTRERSTIDEIRTAYEALSRGDEEPLVALLIRMSCGRGGDLPCGSGDRRRRDVAPTSPCGSQVRDQCYRPHASASWQLHYVTAMKERAAVVLSWEGADGSRVRRAQLLTLRDGRIVRMRDYASPDRAVRAAGARRRAGAGTARTLP